MVNLSIQMKNIGYIKSPSIFNSLQMNLSYNGIYKIIGDNGTGKSTLFKVLNGELDWIKNKKIKIVLNGKKISPFKNRDIVFIKDDFEGYLYLKPIEYIIYITKLYKVNINWEYIDFLFKDLGLNQYSHYLIKNLSQGNKQKLAFICSVILNRPLILFDEAFEHIDLKTIEYIKKNMRSFFENNIILFTSHTQVIDDLADTKINLNTISN
ncbi:ATP-binding cassette domain-containing protein [Staphylococcus aureus]|uniref:AclT n=2 Tax=Staphylococcus aureus TaxID=1280 RepID=X4YKW3_STAAU|nr:ATP-binding cassette domain-containing protein [Staphylococcus aureus]AHV78697.1 AclT [Staphylococcus aureus]ATV90644.1 AclT [Staphylococcus aureus]MDN4125452.1 ATP-binding cassette domain-containing protein [Staphylococcus aureus]PCF67957.1 hypothetical protein CKO30_14630 [Staphylococcus aureus]